MRLIDADVLKKDLSRFYDGIITARMLIDSQPTVELPKEREAVKAKDVQKTSVFFYGVCPSCGKNIDTVFNPVACGYCGKFLKWEDGEQDAVD